LPQINELSEQLDQAVQKKDRKNANALAEKIAKLSKKLGPEFAALVDIERASQPKFAGRPGNRFNNREPRRILWGENEGLFERAPPMKLGSTSSALIIAVLLSLTVAVYAQDQQPEMAKLKADAQKVVSNIKADKAKTQAYCQIGIVGEQMKQAVQAKDQKRFEELGQKVRELEENLGPEYLGLLESLQNVALTSKEGQEIVSTFEKLDESCRH
jgi:hypothetical protein